MEGCRHGKTRSRRAGKAASPRTIAQRANTSTGSIYTRFGGKEELFDALAKEHADTVMSRFMQAQNGFAQPSAAKQAAHMGDLSGQCMDGIACYTDVFRLPLCRAEGTRHEHSVHEYGRN